MTNQEKSLVEKIAIPATWLSLSHVGPDTLGPLPWSCASNSLHPHRGGPHNPMIHTPAWTPSFLPGRSAKEYPPSFPGQLLLRTGFWPSVTAPPAVTMSQAEPYDMLGKGPKISRIRKREMRLWINNASNRTKGAQWRRHFLNYYFIIWNLMNWPIFIKNKMAKMFNSSSAGTSFFERSLFETLSRKLGILLEI